jgi:hypothetical protein
MIDLVDWAAEALLGIIIEISRMVALDASGFSPVHSCGALAHSCFIGVSPTRAIFAHLEARIVVLLARTFNALGSIENWSRSWTVNAFALLNTIYLVGGTVQALSLIKVEVFGMEAFDTAITSPEFTCCTLALL